METDGFSTRTVKKSDGLRFWHSVGAFEGWGLTSGQFTPQGIADKAKSMRLDWLAIQDRPAVRSMRDALNESLSKAGIATVVWQTRPVTEQGANDCISWWNPDAYIAEVETRDGWETFPADIRRDHPDLPLAIITNYWGAGGTPSGYDEAEAKRWWGNKWAIIPECYMVNEEGPQPTLSPDQLCGLSSRLGYPSCFPCFGIYRTNWETYQPYFAGFPNHSWYLIENWE